MPSTTGTTKSKNSPPPQAAIPSATSSSAALGADPFQFSYQGVGDLANVPIRGVAEFFGQPGQTYVPSSKTAKNPFSKTQPQHGWPVESHGQVIPRSFTATETIQQFTLLTGVALAHVQDQLYRAGYYGNAIPKYGLLGDSDIKAFRTMMIGLASNPNQATLGDYLNSAAQQGTTMGMSAAGTAKKIQLTSPDDLRITLQKTVQDLYGGNLSEDDVQKFISAYQSQEASAQSAAATGSSIADFKSGLYDPTSGQAAGAAMAGPTTTVVAPPSVSNAAETYVRTKYPNQVAATQFGNAMQGILATLKNPAA